MWTGELAPPPRPPPLQFPLKSYGFPGAETARKRFLLWEMGFPAAKISCDSDVHAAGNDRISFYSAVCGRRNSLQEGFFDTLTMQQAYCAAPENFQSTGIK